MTSILTHGVVETAKQMNAIVTPRIAQVVDGAIDDMKEFADKYMHDSVLEDAETDMQDERKSPPDHVPDDATDDMQDARGKPPSSTQDDGIVDHDRGTDTVDSVTQEDNSDMADKRDKLNLGKDTVLDDEIHNHTEKLARLTKLGGTIIHKDRPKIVWTVRLAALGSDGKAEVTVTAPNLQPRKVGERDLMAYWKSLGTPARRAQMGAPAPGAPRAPGAATPRAPSSSPALGPSVTPASQPPTEPVEPHEPKIGKKTLAMFEARARKAWAAREAKLKNEHARDLELAKRATVNAFCRAIRIVARRQDAGLEVAPLRQTAEHLLAAPRQLAADVMTGAPVAYPGMDADLVRYVVAEIMRDGRPGDLENLMGRAADLMARGDAYLLDAEADMERFATQLPPITAMSVVSPDPAMYAAEQYRQAAIQGNFAVAAQPVPEGPQFGNHDKRSAIRGAVQGTLVNGTLDRLRAIN